MKNYSIKSRPPPPGGKQGFSLIELMVVISIMTLLTILSLPNIVYLQIKASRAEMYSNLRAISALAHSYHAENGKYTPGTPTSGFSYGIQRVGTNITSDCITNWLGFSATNCEKLYFWYLFSAFGGNGNFMDGTGQAYFTATAWSVNDDYGGGTSYQFGAKLPTRLCKNDYDIDYYYWDVWTIFDNGTMQPLLNSPFNYALKTCL